MEERLLNPYFQSFSCTNTSLRFPRIRPGPQERLGRGTRLSSFSSVRVGSGGEEILVERLWMSHRIPRDMEELTESRGGHMAASRELQNRAWKPHLSPQEANLNIGPASESAKPTTLPLSQASKSFLTYTLSPSKHVPLLPSTLYFSSGIVKSHLWGDGGERLTG